MSNMSYCRFQNTAADLDDCVDIVEEMTNTDAPSLSREEFRAFKDLVGRAYDLIVLLADHSSIPMDDLDSSTKRGSSTALLDACDKLQAECERTEQDEKEDDESAERVRDGLPPPPSSTEREVLQSRLDAAVTERDRMVLGSDAHIEQKRYCDRLQGAIDRLS